jgi:hypothetical protein
MAHRHAVLAAGRPSRSSSRSAARLITALVTALAASACVPPGPGPDPDPTTTTTTTPDPGGCARDTSLPQPGDLTVRLNITGKVVLPNGQPARNLGGHALVRDRRSNVGAVLAEASVNDAGFFLLAAASSTVPADAACRGYWIEICAPSSNGCAAGDTATLHAERDITDLIDEAAGTGPQPIDISNDPLVYEQAG